MATYQKWTPFGVALDITATGGTVKRTAADKFTVTINASWETYYSGASTNYGMSATAGGVTKIISVFGTAHSSGSDSFTGTFSISGNGSATKTITVTFKNYNSDNGDAATKAVSFNVTVPAWTSYTVKYNANGGAGAPSNQTKWKDQALTLSGTKPTRTGYIFKGWATSASGSVEYASGANYTTNAAVTLYAVWQANTYTVRYNANGGTNAPPNQTKSYGTPLILSSQKPTRTNYTFKGWGTSASSTTVAYQAGASYTANATITLYAIWELSYVKPRITSFSVSRCNVDGTLNDSGTYALVKFNWACDLAATSILIEWEATNETGTETVTIGNSAVSGNINMIVGDGSISSDKTYTIRVTVTDSNDNSMLTKNLNGAKFSIDTLPRDKGISFGKPAEKEGYADFAYKGLFRENTEYLNDKAVSGTDIDGTVYIALIPVTTSGNLALGHGLYKVGKGKTNIYGNEVHFYTNNGIYTNSNEIIMNNDMSICGIIDGEVKRVFMPMSENGNTAIGYDNYADKSGNTHLYGHDILHFISNIANPGSYRPYRRKGDSMTLSIRTAGFVTNSGTDVAFHIPFTAPIVGTPTISVTSGNGFILRQGSKYTHGSSATTYVTPISYSTSLHMWHGITITAKFAETTNVTNNDSIGIQWNGTIIFS